MEAATQPGVHCVQRVAPAAEYSPRLQSEHAACPCCGWNEPAAQRVQLALPNSAVDRLPAGHAAHAAVDAFENSPGPHGTHSSRAADGTAPALHCSQVELPRADTQPWGQATQPTTGEAEKKPGSQSMHAVRPASG